jgi:hypothetical protein
MIPYISGKTPAIDTVKRHFSHMGTDGGYQAVMAIDEKADQEKKGRSDSHRRKFETTIELITIKTVDGSTIRGNINLGVKERVSDLFTKSANPFIVLTGVTSGGGSRQTLFVNKQYIVWVEPEGE